MTYPFYIITLIMAFFLCATSLHARDYKNDHEVLSSENLINSPENRYIVIDGDTFHAGQHRVRLWGINAPERNEPYYKESQIVLMTLIGEKRLDCRYVDTDPYERFVMVCFVNGEDLGRLMVKHGYAKDFKRYSSGAYAEEESFARRNKLGMWE